MFKYPFCIASAIMLFALCSYGQAIEKNQLIEAGPIRSSAAYAEVLLRKTELQADLVAVIADYTDTNPKVLDLRFEIAALDKALEKIYSVRPSDTGKLTLALGKLLVKRAGLETDVARLLRTYTNEHREVVRARKRLDTYDAAIREILP